jgi:hypothetical protein
MQQNQPSQTNEREMKRHPCSANASIGRIKTEARAMCGLVTTKHIQLEDALFDPIIELKSTNINLLHCK